MKTRCALLSVFGLLAIAGSSLLTPMKMFRLFPHLKRRLMNRFSHGLSLIAALVMSAMGHQALAITIAMVPVGSPGNTGPGSVNYSYDIGKYEVTVGQCAAFLNAVSATDTYALYNPSMSTDLNIAGIDRSGASGSYTYSVIGSPNHPVTYVNWGDAARFSNWLHNGQPIGAEGPGTTETGAYTLNGAISSAALMAVTRDASATWFIPTENEWYKAAYYQPVAQGGDSDSYWAYPMKTNSVPYSDQPPGATPNNTRVGNFYQDDESANGYDDGFAVTGSTSSSGSQNYLTDVGAYTSSPSFYGTFDQGGNVWEWNESQGVRGGSWGSISVFLQALPGSTGIFGLMAERSDIGFRVASIPIPEPTGIILSLAGVMTLMLWRRKKQHPFYFIPFTLTALATACDFETVAPKSSKGFCDTLWPVPSHW